jgi:O-antigen ligase
VFLQLIYLPNPLIRLISPNTYLLKQQYKADLNPFWFSSLSFYRLATIEELIKFLSFFAIFICTVNILKKKEQFERIILVIIFLGLALSFYGAAKKYFILGKEVTGSFSTFGNRNHFAAYMEMIAPLSLAYALSLRDTLKKIVFGFVAVLICVSVFLSLSRAGTVSLSVSLTIMFFLLFKDIIKTKNYWIALTGMVITLLYFSTAGLGALRARFAVFYGDLMHRFSVAGDSFLIVKDFILFGVGLGNFSYIFTLYQKKFDFTIYYRYLHNDYLQLLVEAGIIASALVLIFFFKIFKDILKEINTRHDPFIKNIVIGGFCGLVSVILHSFVDFNFHIPAVALLFWLLLGLIYKCSYSHFYHLKPESDIAEPFSK